MTPYFENDYITIYHGDCREVLSSLLHTGPRVSAIVTSPPYNVGMEYDHHNDALDAAQYDDLVAVSTTYMAKVLAESGRLWLNAGVSCVMGWATYLNAFLDLRNIVSWRYGIATAETAWGSWQSPSAPNLRRSWEPVLVYSKGDWKRTAPAGFDKWRDTGSDWATLVRNEWTIPPGASTQFGAAEHPAVMPVELARRCIQLSTWPDEIVLDPFMGIGTTAVAAKLLSRRFIGIEKSEHYCEIAVQRLAQEVMNFGGVA